MADTNYLYPARWSWINSEKVAMTKWLRDCTERHGIGEVNVRNQPGEESEGNNSHSESEQCDKVSSGNWIESHLRNTDEISEQAGGG